MAVSLILLDIKDAPGDVTIGDFERQIAVDSFSWSLEAKVQESEAQGKIAKLDAKALNIKKQFDSASTKLHALMQKPDKFKATLSFIDPANRGAKTSAGKINIDSVLVIELTGCRIDRISLSASDSGKSISLSENLVISYTDKATLKYRPFNRVTKVRGNASTADIPPSDPSKG